MKLSEVISRIEKRIPKSWAEPWDNPGLAAGAPGAEVSRIALSLDATPETVAAAASLSCGLLVTHPVSYTHLDVYKRQERGKRQTLSTA